MDKYIIDVPVVLMFFIRQDTLNQVFSQIREAKPSRLFLVCDGPRVNKSSDYASLESSKKIVANIDWDCDVHRIYNAENIGMYKTFYKAMDYVFSLVDRCVFLEDDVFVSLSFFQFCKVMLEKYYDDTRVHLVSGMNHLGIYGNPNSDYFFSGESSIWGVAFWKRTYEMFNHSYRNDVFLQRKVIDLVKKRKKGYEVKFQAYVKNDLVDGHIAGLEYYKNILRFLNSSMCIIPRKNMVKNLGFSQGATNGPEQLKLMPKSIQNLYNMTTYDFDFPLKHPNYVLNDIHYEKKVNSILGFNSKIKYIYRKLSSLFRHILYGDINRILMKLNIRKKSNERRK
jgi:hypothetical protein